MATYIRLTDYRDSESKEQGFFKNENRYEAKQEDFTKIPGCPIAYWMTKRVQQIFEFNKTLLNVAYVRTGLQTGDNERFLKYWHEINFSKIGFGFTDAFNTKESNKKWFPYNKGGDYKKWFGNMELVVNWEDNGKEIIEFGHYLNSIKKPSSRMGIANNSEFYFKESISWSKMASGDLALRYFPKGFIFDVAGSSIFTFEKNMNTYIMSLLNSNIKKIIVKILNPTLSFQSGNMNSIPIVLPQVNEIKNRIDTLTQECIDISKEEWDGKETSWDFIKNELLKHKSNSKIEMAYNNYCQVWSEKFYKLHANEEELNRLFIDIYELGDELTPDVALKDITILKNESIINDNNQLEFKADEIMKQFISYAVGVMFGRYSLDSDGLVVANLNQDYPKDTTFEIDDDNVIPVLEDDYFSDDIASRVVNFVKTTFGSDHLSENINFIEKCLGKTIRAYMVKDFYEDHIKRYKKRPIYWMVSSPKKGFMSLSYMHRYTSDLFARVQNNYLREYIAKLEGSRDTLSLTINSSTATNKDKKDADKTIKNIESKIKELITFDRDTMMSFAQNGIDIDLDDGVKVNYSKFIPILYEIKGLNKDE